MHGSTWPCTASDLQASTQPLTDQLGPVAGAEVGCQVGSCMAEDNGYFAVGAARCLDVVVYDIEMVSNKLLTVTMHVEAFSFYEGLMERQILLKL